MAHSQYTESAIKLALELGKHDLSADDGELDERLNDFQQAVRKDEREKIATMLDSSGAIMQSPKMMAHMIREGKHVR